MTNLHKRLIAGLALGLGLTVAAAPAFAEIPDGPGDLTTCVDIDLEGNPQCPHPDQPEPPDVVDDFTSEDPVDPPVVDDPAPVDDAIVTTPNFTG